MNFHSDEWIMERVKQHYDELLKIYPYPENILGIFYQGAANYGLDTEKSDVDTKAIILPRFDDIAFLRSPKSTTHVMENNEHIDIKDIRVMFDCFKKQNVNYVETIFTRYRIINPMYNDLWEKIMDNGEKIAHFCDYKAIKCMKGMAFEKFHALEKPYPAQVDAIEKYCYAPKQLHHIIRLDYFMRDYIDGKIYEYCLNCGWDERKTTWLKAIKLGAISKEKAQELANSAIEHLTSMADDYCANNKPVLSEEALKILNNIQSDCIKRALKLELEKEDK